MNEFEKAFQEMAAATSTVAERINKLIDIISQGGLSKDEEAKVLAQIKEHTAALTLMGSDVSNPVPPIPDEPV